MEKRTESRRSRPVSSLEEAAGAETSAALAKLGERFALFRAQSPGARVPDELRAAVFNALSEGVTVRELRRECGVAGSQIVGWETTRKSVAPRARHQTTKVRAFSVVKDEPGEGATPKAAPEQTLELRVGPWAVSVRLAGQTPAGQG